MGKQRGGVNKRKLSHSKLVNKQQYKLGKQGKLRKIKSKIKRKQKSEKLRHKIAEELSRPEEAHQESADEEQEQQDTEFFGSADLSFASTIVSNGSEKKAKKRKKVQKDEDDELEENYESNRSNENETNKRLKYTLPLRDKNQVIEQFEEEQAETTDEEPESAEAPADKKREELAPLSVADIYATRQESLTEYKYRIAALASAVVEQPHKHFGKIKELRLMLDERRSDICISVRKLAIASLLELFCDVLPAYRIRQITDEEKTSQLKKETKQLREFEQSLLSNYRHYLDYLQGLIKGEQRTQTKAKARRRQVAGLTVTDTQRATFARLAARTLSRLLSEKPQFNFRSNIINVLIPLLDKREELSEPVREAFAVVFKQDKSGEVTLEIVRAISRFVKARKFDVAERVLEPFLSLRIKEVAHSDGKEDEPRERKLTYKEKLKVMSRRERKREKHMAALERELKETEATHSKKNRLRNHTQTMDSVFVTYFRVLKEARSSKLLPIVLEGLAKFGHLINITFFGDLFSVLSDLSQEDKLTTRESLHCVLTAFTLLSGHGELLTLDPQRFYKRLYNLMLNTVHDMSGEELPIVLDCILKMFSQRRKQVSTARVCAFLKRCSTLALQTDDAGSVGFLSAVRGLIMAFPACQPMLDTEFGGSSVFLPEAADPELSAAHCTALWELTTCTRHYNPLTARFARHVLSGAPSTGEGHLPPEYARCTPREMYERVTSQPLLDKPVANPPKSKRRGPHGGFFQQDLFELSERVLADVDCS